VRSSHPQPCIDTDAPSLRPPMTDRDPHEEYLRREAGHRERAPARRPRGGDLPTSARHRPRRRAARLDCVRGRPPLAVVAPGAGGGVRALPVAHRRVRGRRRQAERGAAHYRRGLQAPRRAMGRDRRTGTRFADPHHPYADDLDILGEGSLYELVCQRARAWERDAGRLAAGAVPSHGSSRATGRRAGPGAAPGSARRPGPPRRGGAAAVRPTPSPPWRARTNSRRVRGFAWARRASPR
jgi:hypothetical protein